MRSQRLSGDTSPTGQTPLRNTDIHPERNNGVMHKLTGAQLAEQASQPTWYLAPRNHKSTPSENLRTMSYEDTHVSRDKYYSLGIRTEDRVCYLEIPVSNRLIDYPEYYRLTQEQYSTFMNTPACAAAFADECRRREHDDLLLEKPGSDRGSAI